MLFSGIVLDKVCSETANLSQKLADFRWVLRGSVKSPQSQPKDDTETRHKDTNLEDCWFVHIIPYAINPN
jgi:hypothetical protein